MRSVISRTVILVQLAACGLALAQMKIAVPTSTASANDGAAGQNPALFTEEKHADVIIRYYSDEVSYMLKPLKMEGPFRTICDRQYVLRLATEQPRHELAVVMLVKYDEEAVEEAVKLGWVNDLHKLHYQRIVFLRADMEMHANGLPIIAQIPAVAAK
jgi:hypothetical protein